jgi:hypothetical protein
MMRYAAARAKGEYAPEYYEFRALHRDGRRLWIANTVRAIEWEGGPAVQATLYDVTERRTAEEELARSRNLLGTVIDSLPHLIAVRDREARTVLVNKAWRDANGLPPERYLHRTPLELGLEPVAERQVVYEESLAVVRTESPRSHEHDLTQGGRVRRMHTVRTPLRGEDGSVVGVVSISEDITERRAMQAQLHQAQKMEAVGQLTGGIAHDFNNLLGIVMGNLELLDGRVADDSVAQRYTQRAISATQRGAALTRRLLAFARRQTLQPQAVSLARQVTEVVELLQGSLDESIAIEIRRDPDAGLVYVDPVPLQNSLLNLMLNARDAMPTGGTLTIEVRRIPAMSVPDLPRELWSERELVLLAVRDTGAGMPEDVLARAAEPFFTTKEAGSGNGLGLSMVDGFMTQSGGLLRIESRPGEGTRVNLYFRPCEDDVQLNAPVPAPAPADDEANAVLVVEDDPAVRMLAMHMLAALNYAAVEASDGHEALQMLREHAGIRLLFTDLGLPNGMDGLELAEEARRLRPDLKVLFTSGYAEKVLVRHARGIDASILVQKPYRLSDLARKIEGALARGAPSDA